MIDGYPGRTSFEQGSNEPTELDINSDEYTEKFLAAPIFVKKVRVHVRAAIPGEKIITILADGTRETSREAIEGDSIITNPGSEEYVISKETLAKRYESTDEEGVFRAKGMARIVPNETGHPITVMTNWGPQNGDENCLLAAGFDPNTPEELGRRYIVGSTEFKDTYGSLEEVFVEEA